MLFTRPSTRFAAIGLTVAALLLSGCAQSERDSSGGDSSDTTARVLGIVGIVIGIAGVAFGVLAGRRRNA